MRFFKLVVTVFISLGFLVISANEKVYATCRIIMEETGYNDPHCPSWSGCTQTCSDGGCYTFWDCYGDGGYRWQYWSSDSLDCWCGGGSCFLPGTQVATPQGDKSIETLKPGDAVFSFNELTGKRVLNTVQNSPVRTVQEYYIIKTQSGREVKTTAEHPFLTKVGSQRDAGAGTSGKLEALGDLVRLIRSKLVSITGGLK